MTLPDDVTIKGRDEKEQPTPGGWLESSSGPPRSSRTGEGVGGEAQEWWHKGEICRHRHTDTHYSHIDKHKFSLSLTFLHILSYTHKQAGRQAGLKVGTHSAGPRRAPHIDMLTAAYRWRRAGLSRFPSPDFLAVAPTYPAIGHKVLTRWLQLRPPVSSVSISKRPPPWHPPVFLFQSTARWQSIPVTGLVTRVACHAADKCVLLLTIWKTSLVSSTFILYMLNTMSRNSHKRCLLQLW